MNMLEKVDIYDENKNKTGKVKIRHKDKLLENEYIIGVQAIIINSNKEILISRRSKDKKVLPLKWECNGGAIKHGEDELSGLKREISEELGITLDKSKAIYLKTVKKANLFKVIYLFFMDIDIKNISFEDKEAIDAKWVSIDTYMKMFKNGEIVFNNDFLEEDYKKCIEILFNS